MKKNFSRPFGSMMKVVVFAFAMLATVALVYLLQRSVFRPLLSEDGVPIPFVSEGGTSVAGSITTIGSRGGIALREVSFDNNEASEALQGATHVDSIDFVLTPDSPTISDGATLAQAITPGRKVFGYKYTSRSAVTEREMATLLAEGEPISFAQLFPGQFFVSDAQRADGSMIANFEMSRGITFLPLSAVELSKNARYIIVSNSANTTFTARGLSVCGNSQVESEEQCDDGAQNGVICDSVMGGSCQYCSTTCMILNVSPSTPVCGNEVTEAGEQCDDGNTFSGDGCSSTCQTEQGGGQSHLSCMSNMCVSVPGAGPNGCASDSDCSPPQLPVCGNEVTELGEQCDDGNTQSGDGCSSTCQTESMMVLWHNSVQPMDVDNDGIVASDDAVAVIAYLNNIPPNTQAVDHDRTPTPRYPDVNNDGLVTPVDALIINNWIASQCGNGQFEPVLGEECDDGNTVTTDSCSNTCKLLSAPF